MVEFPGQRVTFRAPARIGAIAASLAAAAALLLPSSALAATPIGSPTGTRLCDFSADTVQATSSGPSYAVPADGTAITDWFFQAASTDTGSVNLLVWRPSGPQTYTLIAVSPTVDLSDPLSTFALLGPIPVLPGDLLGLRLTGLLTCSVYTANQGDTVGLFAFGTAVGDLVSFGSNNVGVDVELNVGASVETTSNPVATDTSQCKNGGWKTLADGRGTAFKNQGDCVSFVATKGKNSAS
jgi:hypothetical protein